MPIKGLSDKVYLPRLGRIRLGVMEPSGQSSCPRAVDYFVCPDPVKKVFGDRPRELPVLLPDEDDSRWAAQYYRCYFRTRGLVCKGDGEKASALIDPRTGSLATHSSRRSSLKEIECRPDTCACYGRQCRRVMNLRFLLPDVPGLGVWQIDTSSLWSITNINSALHFLRQVCGRASGIPLTLRLQPRQVQLGGLKNNIYVLVLDSPMTMPEMLCHAQKSLSGGLSYYQPIEQFKEKETHVRS